MFYEFFVHNIVTLKYCFVVKAKKAKDTVGGTSLFPMRNLLLEVFSIWSSIPLWFWNVIPSHRSREYLRVVGQSFLLHRLQVSQFELFGLDLVLFWDMKHGIRCGFESYLVVSIHKQCHWFSWLSEKAHRISELTCSFLIVSRTTTCKVVVLRSPNLLLRILVLNGAGQCVASFDFWQLLGFPLISR